MKVLKSLEELLDRSFYIQHLGSQLYVGAIDLPVSDLAITLNKVGDAKKLQNWTLVADSKNGGFYVKNQDHATYFGLTSASAESTVLCRNRHWYRHFEENAQLQRLVPKIQRSFFWNILFSDSGVAIENAEFQSIFVPNSVSPRNGCMLKTTTLVQLKNAYCWRFVRL